MKAYVKLFQHFFTRSNNLYDFYPQNSIIHNLTSTMIDVINQHPSYFELYDDDIPDDVILSRAINKPTDININYKADNKLPIILYSNSIHDKQC
ncbi:MAG: hypothetical protein QXV17_01490 [Candidatus Micrarchaeaceae archaeon]